MAPHDSRQTHHPARDAYHMNGARQLSTNSGVHAARLSRCGVWTLLTAMAVALLLAGCGPSASASITPTATPAYSYSASWQMQTVHLTLAARTLQVGVSDYVIQGEAVHFQTNDPRYTCLNDKPHGKQALSLPVFAEPAEYPPAEATEESAEEPGEGVAEEATEEPGGEEPTEYTYVITSVCPNDTSVGGVWTFHSVPSQCSTTAQYQTALYNQPRGQTVCLVPYAGDSTKLLKGILAQSANQAIVTSFKITDAQSPYTCFNGTSLKVYSVPNNPIYLDDPYYRPFDNRFIVYDTCLDGTTGVWTFAPTYHYLAVWDNEVEADNEIEPPIVPMSLARYGNPVPPSTNAATTGNLIGHLASFQTDDPAYSCLNGTSIDATSFPAVYRSQSDSSMAVVYGTCTNSIPGAWTFTLPLSDSFYEAFWPPSRGGTPKEVDLTPYLAADQHTLVSANTIQELATNFETDDPAYYCLIGTPLNVAVPAQPVSPDLAGKYIAYGTCLKKDGTSVVYRWTFNPLQNG